MAISSFTEYEIEEAKSLGRPLSSSKPELWFHEEEEEEEEEVVVDPIMQLYLDYVDLWEKSTEEERCNLPTEWAFNPAHEHHNRLGGIPEGWEEEEDRPVDFEKWASIRRRRWISC